MCDRGYEKIEKELSSKARQEGIYFANNLEDIKNILNFAKS